MNILQKLVDAQLQLQSTQRNWDEECLFKCNDLLGEVIRELEERLTKHAPDVVESTASVGVSPASEVSASEADSTPATTQVM